MKPIPCGRGTLALCAAALATACSGPHHVRSADREVEQLLRDFDREVLEGRESRLLQPRPSVEPEAEPPAEPGVDDAQGSDPASEPGPTAPPEAESLEIGLADALHLAVTSGREFVARRESLYLSGLGLTMTRFSFGPQLDATLGYVWGDSRDGPRSHSLGTGFGVSQILPTGGRVAVDAGASLGRTQGPHLGDPDRGISSSTDVSVSLSQPLLRGAGYAVSHESLTQAERSMVYSIRDFELFRQDFSIRVADQYFQLVNQQKAVAIQVRQYKDAEFDVKRAEALKQVDRVKDLDVIVAKRALNSAETRLIDARANFDDALERFAISLGLPRGTKLVIREEPIGFEPVRIDEQSAIDAALHNRLDIQTAADQLEDVDRNARLAANDLLPDVGMSLRYGRSDSGGRNFSRAFPGAESPWSTSASLSIDIPIQQKAQRNAYRSTLIGQERAHRDHQEFLDGEVAAVKELLRNLRNGEQQILLQEQQIEQDSRSVRVVQVRLESGSATNRDLTEARQAVTDAELELNRLQVEHFLTRLRLQRAMGTFFVDENGLWR